MLFPRVARENESTVAEPRITTVRLIAAGRTLGMPETPLKVSDRIRYYISIGTGRMTS